MKGDLVLVFSGLFCLQQVKCNSVRSDWKAAQMIWKTRLVVNWHVTVFWVTQRTQAWQSSDGDGAIRRWNPCLCLHLNSAFNHFLQGLCLDRAGGRAKGGLVVSLHGQTDCPVLLNCQNWNNYNRVQPADLSLQILPGQLCWERERILDFHTISARLS